MNKRLLSLLPLLALVALAPGCRKRRYNDPAPVVVPAYGEVEVNDAAAQANDFGLLRPGDHFFIDGFITDSGADPFDGFLFTATQPIHVDFQLFIDNGAADLDVYLYDPQIDADVAVFDTSLNPERGGVDVFSGGLDFHLVVQSWVGTSTYSMEILVYPLFVGLEEGASEAQAAEPEAGLARAGGIAATVPADVLALRASGVAVDKGDRGASFADYAAPAREPEPLLEEVLQFDPETGTMILFLRRAETE